MIDFITRPSSSSSSSTSTDPLLRRRRRRVGKAAPPSVANNQNATSSAGQLPSTTTTTAYSDSGAAFAPKDSNGNLLDAQEYLSLASLSPWVPCPELVIKRVFEIAEATEQDVHVDLGCGDGRLNFAAVGGPFHVRKSWGVDVDSNILEKCHERLGRRFVPSGGGGGFDHLDRHTNNISSESERLEFLQADLIQVVERQKEQYQQLQSSAEAAASGSKEDDITRKLTQSTIVTMYFVNDALIQLQPYLESTLGGRENVRVITVGYEMKGWDATWVERVLGLTIFKYDMKDVSNDPLEWRVGGGEEEDEATSTMAIADEGGMNKKENALPATPPSDLFDDFDGDYTDIDEDESSELANYLRQKQKQDMEELNNGLEIHHDEKLDDFAQSRSKRNNIQNNSIVEEDVGEEWDGDFDETEDPEELLKDAHRVMAEARMGDRGKGMMAGLDASKKKDGGKGRKAEINAKAKPVWKKP
ncbi:hypothetical protein ACHAXR_006729 [Thalassiosira sp. AJA248-18]